MRRRSPKVWRKQKLLIDANILLLYIVGTLSAAGIERHKRTKKFTVEDYRLLQKHLRRFGEIVVTPNVLTEVSNLLGYTDEATKTKLLALLGTLAVQECDEHYVRSSEAVKTAEFLRLGLTDASILSLQIKELVVLTDDLDLYLALRKRGIEAVNFNHLRDEAWG